MKENRLPSALIYGAGKGCDELFEKFDIGNKYTIVGIIDSDDSKKGQKYSVRHNNTEEQFDILSPGDIIQQNDIFVIISVRLSSVLDVYRLIISKGINEDIILYYDRQNQILSKLTEVKFFLVAKEIEREYHVKQIQFAMLSESFFDDEFFNCKTIAVIGKSDEVNVMKFFLDKIAPNLEVTCLGSVDEKNRYDKSIFVSDDYMEQIEKYESLYDDKKWIVLPFYDVNNRLL